MADSHQAFWIGVLSAASLPLGAVLGLVWTPSSRLMAAVMAFGSGSLVAALTLELVAEAILQGGFWAMASGMLVGGGVFLVLNHLLNQEGGFLRKPATTRRVAGVREHDRLAKMLEQLSAVEIFRALPPEEFQALLHHIHEHIYESGAVVVRQGEAGDACYVVTEGRADVIHEIEVETSQATVQRREEVARLNPGDVFGEMSLLTGEGRNATVRAATTLSVLRIRRDDFDRLVALAPRLSEAVKELRKNRDVVLQAVRRRVGKETQDWMHQALQAVRPRGLGLGEVQALAKGHAAAPLAICLGALLDNIPESVVVGASLIHQPTVNLSLVAAVFLSNGPEAWSSAVGMKRTGYRGGLVLTVWALSMILNGVGSWVGFVAFQGRSPMVLAGLEGVAAGAMLTMVSETMLPEAYEHASSMVGLSTLLGFLATIYFKLLGHG